MQTRSLAPKTRRGTLFRQLRQLRQLRQPRALSSVRAASRRLAVPSVPAPAPAATVDDDAVAMTLEEAEAILYSDEHYLRAVAAYERKWRLSVCS